MPEGPEIKLVAQQLGKEVNNHTLTKINILSGPYKTGTGDKYKSFRTSLKKFVRAAVSKIETKGKTIYWELTPTSSDNVVVNEYLVIGFGLTGGFKLHKTDHSRLEFVFADADGNVKNIYYDDMRNFGTFAFVKRQDLNAKLEAMGPDVFEITADELEEQLAISSIKKHEIAKALLNQKIVAGIGNYLRAEILYEAGIDPLKRVEALTFREITGLHAAIMKVIGEVVASGGSPNYEDLYDQVGTYKFRVYQQKKAPDGRPVVKTDLAGRAVYHV